MPKVDDVAEVQINLDTAVYADGDLLCQAVELEQVCVENYPSFVESATVLDYDDQGDAITLILFRSNPGNLGVVNAAMAISDAQAEEVLGVIEVAATDYSDLGAQQIAQPEFYPLKVRATNGGTSIWIAGKAGAASTYASGRLLVKLGTLKIE